MLDQGISLYLEFLETAEPTKEFVWNEISLNDSSAEYAACLLPIPARLTFDVARFAASHLRQEDRHYHAVRDELTNLL